MTRTALTLILASLLTTSVARAQAGPGTERANALGHEALEAYRKNDWAAAYARFAEAEAAAHSPVFVLYMARSKRSAGDLLAARDLLSRVAGEVVASGAPEPWKRARADAARELAELEGRIPAVIVALRGAPEIEVAVSIDDVAQKPEAVRAPIRLNPGPHTVQVTAPGRAPITRSVRLVEGDPPQRVEIDLAPPAPPPPAITPPPASNAPAAITPPVITPPPSATTRGSFVPGAIVTSVGAGGLVAGAILGGLARGAVDSFTQQCTKIADGYRCPTSVQGDVSRASGLQTGANAAFIGGGIVAATGVVLLIVRPGGGKQSSARVLPGVGSVVIEGRF